MKKNILLSLASFMFFFTAKAQDNTSEEGTLLRFDNNKGSKFTIGARLGVDAAYYSTDFTPLKSGYALDEARIRTSYSYGDNWYFYADFDFSYGKFKQKDIYLRYSWKNQSLKAGYFAEPSSMSLNTSRYAYHFITRASSANALQNGRALGIAYQYVDNMWFASQGIFAENNYNNQEAGNQGVALSGRWLFKPINDGQRTLHVGVSGRYAIYNTGEYIDGVLHRNLTLGSGLETNVDPTKAYLSADIPWAKNVYNINAEALYVANKIFVRGEYMYKHVGKERDDKRLFENQLGDLYSWTTLESWRKGNPLRSSKFHGAYVEAGFLILGDSYSYNNSKGVVNPTTGENTLEFVARYNYTNLNDITKGDVYFVGRDQFYPNGVINDYPTASTSIAGGLIHSGTVGLNYGINDYVKLMFDYTYTHLDKYQMPMDKNIHTVQGRLLLNF